MTLDVNPKGEVLIYQTVGGNKKIDVYFKDDTVWLPQSLTI